MPNFIYTVWFRDPDASPGDQGYEWPACLRIEADTMAAALNWGDTLARGRSLRFPPAIFLHSSVEPENASERTSDDQHVPDVRDGQDATDREIGW